MKNMLLFAFIMFASMLSAQTITISDLHLKNKLLSASPQNDIAKNSVGVSIKIDANNDGEIQLSEAVLVWSLKLFATESSFDIIEVTNFNELQYFTNLRELSIVRFAFQAPSTFDASMLTNLTVLNLSQDNLTSINVSGLTNLYFLSCSHNNLQLLNLENLTMLEEVDCQSNALTSLQLPAGLNLTGLNCSENNLSIVDFSACTGLKGLWVANNNFTVIEFDELINLEEFSLYGNNLSGELDISMLTQLQDIEFSNNNISGVNFGNISNLAKIYCRNNQLSTLDISELTLLIELDCENNNITSVDFSTIPDIELLKLAENPINYINLKHGAPFRFNHYFTLTAYGDQSIYFCVNEDMEEDFVQNFFQQYDTAVTDNFIISTYCSFTPGGNYNTIAGNFTFDGDTNGCTASDALTHQVKLSVTDGTLSGTAYNNQGNYNFYTQGGNFILTPQFENNWFTATPATATVNFANNNNNASTQNFCIAPNGLHPDVEVVIVPIINAQPGFDARYKIVYKNKGNQTLSGNVVFNYDEAVLDFVASGSTVPASTASGQLTWAYSNLLPFESRTVNAVLNLNGPMETPPVEIDDVLNYMVSITPATGDETPADNTFILNQVVTGSFDPNDITCLEGESVHPDMIGKYLHYNINFENTGTAPATFIVVKDIIDAAKFDVNSLQLMDASHNIETRITGNKVEFIFDDINLGAGQKGNVLFKIKTRNTVQVNSSVMNKADIFFDYNWPIATNDANTTFQVLSSGDFAVDNSVTLYPNPAKDVVNIKAGTLINSVQLYDLQGRLLQAATGNDSVATLEIANRPSGIYFVKISTEKGTKVEKIVKE